MSARRTGGLGGIGRAAPEQPVGVVGELSRAIARASVRSRGLAELVVVAVLAAMPVSFVGEAWRVADRDELRSLHLEDVPTPLPVEMTPSPTTPTPRPVVAAVAAPPAGQMILVARAPQPPGEGEWVLASWYGPGFYGNRTACGQVFTAESWVVAHKTLPCGTVVEITFRGRTVTAPVLDRGPFIPGREVDLGEAVAKALGFAGVQPVRLRVR